MKTKLFKRLSMLLFGGVMVLSAAVGISNNKETKTVYAENSTYTMTIDSNASGENNVHYTSTSTNSIKYNDVEWSINVTGTSSITSNKAYCQIGSKSNPATKVEISTKAFAGMTIVSASLDGYCMSNDGPKLTILAGETKMLEEKALVKGTSDNYSTVVNDITLGVDDSFSFIINSSAKAAIAISKITVEYSTPESSTGPYTVTYNSNGASSGSIPTDSNEYTSENNSVTVLGNTGNLEKDGYTFGGWNTKADGTGTNYNSGDIFTITNDAVLFAVWNKMPMPATDYKIVTDASSLNENDQIIITSSGSGNIKAMSTTQNDNNRGAVDVIEKNGAVAVSSDDVQIITLIQGTKEGSFGFYTGSGYLYAASGTSNHLRTQNNLDANGSFKISIDGENKATVKAQGTNSRNLLQYNTGSKIFSCYGTNQASISIYKKTVTSVELSECENIIIDETKTISVSAPGEVTWSIESGSEYISLSNESDTGVDVTGLAVGTAVIKATCGELSATCTINVTEIPDYTGSYTITSNTTKYQDSLTESDIGNYLNNFDIFTPKTVTDVRLGSGSDIARTCIAIPGTNDVGETGEFSFDCPNGYIASKVIVDCFKDQYKDTTLSINNSYWENFSYNENSSMKYVALCYSKNVDISAISRLWIKSITVTLIKEESNSIVDAFFSQILDLTAADCAALDVKNDTWTILQTGFGNIEENYFEAAYEIIDATEFVEANARYDYIVAKYGYNNFLEHNVTTFKQANTRPFEISSTEDSSLLLIIIALSSTLTLSVVLLYRKKKHTN